MCANYELAIDPDLVYEVFSTHGVKIKNNAAGDYQKESAFPNKPLLTIRKQGKEYESLITKWGIKFPDRPQAQINSKAETVSEKPYWKRLFSSNRALLPMTGFFEHPVINGKKVRHKIFVPGEPFFFVPALYIEMGGVLCTSLITVEPNKFMQPIHNRMPSILLKKDVMKLLDGSFDDAIKLCVPFEGDLDIADASKR